MTTKGDSYALTGLSSQFTKCDAADRRTELELQKYRLNKALQKTSRRLENTLIQKRSKARQELERARRELRVAELMAEPNKHLNRGQHLQRLRVHNSTGVSNAVFSEPQIQRLQTTQQLQGDTALIVAEMARDPVLSTFNKVRRTGICYP